MMIKERNEARSALAVTEQRVAAEKLRVAELEAERDRLDYSNEAKRHHIELAVTKKNQYAEALDNARDLLCLADEAFMRRHGCFPLDRRNDDEQFWCDALSKIREVTGNDYESRVARANAALNAPAYTPMQPVADTDLIDRALAAEQRVAALVGALTETLAWINYWDPQFVDDEEWPATRAKIDAALAKEAKK